MGIMNVTSNIRDAFAYRECILHYNKLNGFTSRAKEKTYVRKDYIMHLIQQ